MVTVTSRPRYHPRYQRRSSMFICGLIPRNFTELAKAVPIDGSQSITATLSLLANEFADGSILDEQASLVFCCS